MSAPSPVTSMQTPQREFAGAKLLKKFDLYKFYDHNLLRKLILQAKIKK